MRTVDTIKKYRESIDALSETNDCTVRALAAMMNISYEEAHDTMRRHGRKNRGGSFVSATARAYSEYGLTLREENNPTFAQWLRANPRAKAIVRVRGHVFTVKNGVVYGNNNDAARKRARVRGVFIL